MSTQELVIHSEPTAIQRASDFMPVFDIRLAVERKEAMTEFIGRILNPDADYGQIPGTQKPTLLKPGAEKLASFFGLSPMFIDDKVIENWGTDGTEPLFYYRVKCRLMKNGKVIAEAGAACSSWESKYRYRWVTEDQLGNRKKEGLRSRGGVATLVEPAFAIDKAETTGRYGKPQAHWDLFRAAIQDGRAQRTTKETKAGKPMDCWAITVNQVQYQIPNPDIYDLINTVMKMAYKRALVAAVLLATNASDSFTQDLEDQDKEREDWLSRDEDPLPETPKNVQKVEEPKKREPAPPPPPQPKPAPPPPPAGDEVPQPVQDIWKAMGTKVGTINSAFLTLKAAIGDENADEYYGILAKHGMDAPTDCMKVGMNKTRVCILDLWRAADRIKTRPFMPGASAAASGELFDAAPESVGAYGKDM